MLLKTQLTQEFYSRRTFYSRHILLKKHTLLKTHILLNKHILVMTHLLLKTHILLKQNLYTTHILLKTYILVMTLIFAHDAHFTQEANAWNPGSWVYIKQLMDGEMYILQIAMFVMMVVIQDPGMSRLWRYSILACHDCGDISPWRVYKEESIAGFSW